MNKKTVLLILVDGMRHDYINSVDSPFLDALGKQNINAIVRETFAFELRPAFFAGLQPEECDIANMFCYDPDNSLFRSIDVSHGDRDRIALDLKSEAEKRGYTLVRHIGGSAEIPLELLNKFDFSEKYHTTDPGAIANHKTLFDYLRDDGKKWLWIAYPDGPAVTKGVLEQFLAAVTGDEDFIYLHFSELDWVGHEFGPHSVEQKKVLKEIDEAIRKIFCKLNQSFLDVRSIIFGDHGQVEVKKNIDIETMLNNSGLMIEKDYLYFLDSTQARFWFFNDYAKNKIIDLLSTIPEGKILTENDYERLRFRFKHNKFGEVIFVVNDGVGIFPNFFQHTSPCKGLHGYLPEVEGNWAKLIIAGCGITKNIHNPVEMTHLFPTLLELLNLKKPSAMKLQSIFEMENVAISPEKYDASIIIPTYNRLDILKKCLSAIEKQNCPDGSFELIVVNDGSADGTDSFLEEYQKNTKLNFKYFTQANAGPAAARNVGIKNAEGHIIILLGDDMIPTEGFIDAHLKFHHDWPQLSHASLGLIEWSQDIEITPLMDFIASPEGGHQFNYDHVFKSDPDKMGCELFWSSNVSFKKLFALTHGLFNAETFKHAMWEDVEMGLRLEKAGLNLHFRPECKTFHEHSISFNSFAERQRMVGWYSHDLERMGLPYGFHYRDMEKELLYSRTVLREIVKAVEAFEKERGMSNPQMLKRLYNIGLHYAAMVGYAERDQNLREDIMGTITLLYNLSLLKEADKEKEGHIDSIRTEIGNLSAAIREKDGYLENLSAAIREKDSYLENLKRYIKDSESQISVLKTLIKERDAHISGLKGAITEKDVYVGNLETGLKERDAYIGNIEAVLKWKDTSIKNLEVAIRDTENLLQEKEADLTRIYESHGWKILVRYYKVRGKIFPDGSRLQTMAKKIFHLGLRIKNFYKNSKPSTVGNTTPVEEISNEHSAQPRKINEIRFLDPLISLAESEISKGSEKLSGSCDINELRELHFELTYLCNEECVMCNVWPRYKENPELRKKELTNEDIYRFVEGSSYLKNLRMVLFSGGEPFLRKDLPELCGFFIDKYKSLSVGILSNLFATNLIMKKVDEIVRHNPSDLWIGSSIDGIGEVHDRIRGVPGSFKALENSIEAMKKMYPQIRMCLNFTVTPENYFDLEKAYYYAKANDLGFGAQFAVQWKDVKQFHWDQDNFMNSRELTHNIMKDMATDFIHKNNIKEEDIFSNKGSIKGIYPALYYWKGLIDYQQQPHRRFSRCVAGSRFTQMSPTGDLYFCPLLKNKIIGNIRDYNYNFDSIWTSEEAIKLRKFIEARGCHCWLSCTIYPNIEDALNK